MTDSVNDRATDTSHIAVLLFQELIEENRHIHLSSLGIAGWILFLATEQSENIKDGNVRGGGVAIMCNWWFCWNVNVVVWSRNSAYLCISCL